MPKILYTSRLLFGIYVLYYALDWHFGWFLGDRLSIVWLGYLCAIYVLAEIIYHAFKKRGVNLVYAFPVLFIESQVDFASIIFRSQDNLNTMIINRAEHFVMYLLVTYVVSQFFLRYLPQRVWSDHPYYTAILILSVAQTIGVMNEIFELFMDTNFHTTAIGPRFDTNLDLLMNFLGSSLFLCVQLIIHEAQKAKILKTN
jgi:hypothetical protein